MLGGIVGEIVGALFKAIVGGTLTWLRETRTEKRLLKLGFQQNELDRAGVSRLARKAARERQRDVLNLTMAQIVGVNRDGAAALGVRERPDDDDRDRVRMGDQAGPASGG